MRSTKFALFPVLCHVNLKVKHNRSQWKPFEIKLKHTVKGHDLWLLVLVPAEDCFPMYAKGGPSRKSYLLDRRGAV